VESSFAVERSIKVAKGTTVVTANPSRGGDAKLEVSIKAR
jgi:hypothetical protein